MPIVVSVYGPSGSGKSTLAKALVGLLGPDAAARVPADYYLRPRVADETREGYLARPLEYDWELIDGLRVLPEGTEATTPAFDFSAFQRSADGDGRTFAVRPVLVLDAMRPYPRADVRVLLTAAEAVRRARVETRDRAWGTAVAARWASLELTGRLAAKQAEGHDLRLDGGRDPAINAAEIAGLLVERYPQIWDGG